MEKVIGIDLGTTNSCVAVVEGGTAGRHSEPRWLQDHAVDGRDHRGGQAPGRSHRQAPGDHQRREHGLRGQAPDRPQVEQAAGQERDRDVPLPHRRRAARRRAHPAARQGLQRPRDQRDDPAGDEDDRRGLPRRRRSRRRSSPSPRTSTTTSVRRPRTPARSPASTSSASSTSRPRRRSRTASASSIDSTVAVYDLGGGTFDISILEIGCARRVRGHQHRGRHVPRRRGLRRAHHRLARRGLQGASTASTCARTAWRCSA